MKKFLTGIVAAATLFSAGAAFAANQVQVTLTSPTIVKSGCEKAGSVQFAFDAASVITQGDWWYMDLPVNVSLCKNYDYIIGGGATGAAPALVLATATNTVTGAAAMKLSSTILSTTATGPVTASITGTPAAATVAVGTNYVDGAGGGAVDGEIQAVECDAANKMAFRVVGVTGSRRITVYALGTAVAAPWDKMTVGKGYKLNIKIMDGKAWNVTATTTSMIFTAPDTAATTTYGKTPAGVIGGSDTVAAIEPAVENTLCIDASAPAFTNDLVFTSFASRSDFFTFTGDSQIAHTGASASISLKNCKTSDLDQISISGQNTSCSFSYNYTNNYSCPGHTLFNDNLLIQTTSGIFGELGDMYQLTTTSMTNGVYFGDSPSVYGYASTQDSCSKTVVPTTLYTTAVPGTVTLTKYITSAATTAAYQADNKCTIQATKKIDSVKLAPFSLDAKNVLRVDLPSMIYDTAIIGNGTEVKVKATLGKIPCGTIFEGTVTIGSFVTTCSSATTTTSVLLFPFFPPMDPAAAPGWWGGYLIVNGGSVAGTANLIYSDAAGATKTYTTPSIAVGAQFNGTTVTPAMLAAGTGTFDATKNYSIKAYCGFDHAAGFAFVSSPEAAASYTAYVDDAARFL